MRGAPILSAAAASAKLTPAMSADLRRLVARVKATAGSYDYPSGDALALRTGPAIERRGLVYCANRYTANKRRRWLPTMAGFVIGEQGGA